MSITELQYRGRSGMVNGNTKPPLSGIEARLTKIEGQIRGIRGMTVDGRACVDVVAQIAAVRGALKKVADMLVAEHVEEWLAQAQSGSEDDHRQNVEDLLKVFNQYYR